MKKLFTMTVLLLAVSLFIPLTAQARTPNLEVTIPRVENGPQIDGSLGDTAWLEASRRGAKVVQDIDNHGNQLTDYPRVVYLCYDDEALYVAFVMFAPDIDDLETSSPDPWDNDEVEVFIQAPEKEYFQINVDADEQYNISDDGPEEIEYAVYKGDIKWRVEIGISFDDIGIEPDPGDTWKIGLCGRQVAVGDMWLTWNPTYGGFHNPDRFGTLIFGE